MPFDLIAAARELVRLDTSPGNSTASAVRLLTELGQQVGLDQRLQEEWRDGIRQQNVLLATREMFDRKAAPKLLLNTHLDTVPPGANSEWTETFEDPFRLVHSHGHLYGLGAADVKLDFLCKLAAMDRLISQGCNPDAVLVGTYGEETGRFGARLVCRQFRPLPRFVLVGEPSELRPVTQHKGYMEIHCSARDSSPARASGPLWSVVFSGRSAHSSQPHLGRSAITACIEWIASRRRAPQVLEVRGGDVVNRVPAECRLTVAAPTAPVVAEGAARVHEMADDPGLRYSPSLERCLVRLHKLTELLRSSLEACTDAAFDPPWSSVNVGRLTMTADALSYILDVRRVPGSRPAQLVDQFVKALEENPAGEPALSVHTELDSNPFRADDDSTLLSAVQRSLRRAGLSAEPAAKSGTTEASVYQQAGTDAIVFGPGTATGNIHRPNERVPLADVRNAIDIYEQTVLQFGPA